MKFKYIRNQIYAEEFIYRTHVCKICSSIYKTFIERIDYQKFSNRTLTNVCWLIYNQIKKKEISK